MSKRKPGYWKARKEKIRAYNSEFPVYGPPAPQTAAYERAFVIPLEQGLEYIRRGLRTKEQRGEAKIELNGIRLSIQSSGVRLPTFLKSLTCAKCGLEGTYFAAERKRGDKCGYHMNLWGKALDGSPMLFTHDHIIPRSKGGPDHLSNSQTMCVICNETKGDSL